MEKKESCQNCALYGACWEEGINPGNACPDSDNDNDLNNDLNKGGEDK